MLASDQNDAPSTEAYPGKDSGSQHRRNGKSSKSCRTRILHARQKYVSFPSQCLMRLQKIIWPPSLCLMLSVCISAGAATGMWARPLKGLKRAFNNTSQLGCSNRVLDKSHQVQPLVSTFSPTPGAWRTSLDRTSR